MATPQSVLLLKEHVPHFINSETKPMVLACYRELHRNLSRLADPFSRSQLKTMAQHGFARYKFVASSSKINALIGYAQAHEMKWAAGAAKGNSKDVAKVLELAFTTYGVKESPLKQIFYCPPRLCDHKTLWYKLNNVTMPTIRKFEDHDASAAHFKKLPLLEIRNTYWQLVELLRSNGIKTGTRRRKLLFSPEALGVPIVTVFGQPLPLSRQANLLKSLYDQFLRDAPRPIHPEALQYIESQLNSTELSRLYRRRFKDLASNLFSIDNTTGKMITLHV